MLSQAVSQKRHPQGVKGSLFCELVANLMDVESAKDVTDRYVDGVLKECERVQRENAPLRNFPGGLKPRLN